MNQTISYRPGLKVSWSRYGHNLQISGRTGLLFSSVCALPNFSPSEEVQKTTCQELMGKDELISPVFELSQKISGMEFDTGFYQDLYPFPQMLVIAEHNWKLDHLVAQGLFFQSVNCTHNTHHKNYKCILFLLLNSFIYGFKRNKENFHVKLTFIY